MGVLRILQNTTKRSIMLSRSRSCFTIHFGAPAFLIDFFSKLLYNARQHTDMLGDEYILQLSISLGSKKLDIGVESARLVKNKINNVLAKSGAAVAGIEGLEPYIRLTKDWNDRQFVGIGKEHSRGLYFLCVLHITICLDFSCSYLYGVIGYYHVPGKRKAVLCY